MRKAGHKKKDPIESLLRKPPIATEQGLSELRYLILTQGMPNDTSESDQYSYRPYIWALLLQVPPVQAKEYINLIHRGASPAYSKIRNDTFRTLTTDIAFQRKVSETSLIRVLNALAWRRYDAYVARRNQHQELQQRPYRQSRIASGLLNTPSRIVSTSTQATTQSSNTDDECMAISELYVQGLNVLAAPFLYSSASETQAFALFDTFAHVCCPLYVKPMLDGVHLGLKLLDTCLKIIDPTLYSFLKSKLLTAELYGFASVLTMSACTPPLSEVLILWDFLLAFGAHMNVLAVIAQLLLIRDSLLSSASPMQLLRTFPPLQAKKVITLAVSFVPKLPEELYNLLVRHTYDESVTDKINKL
ncbi:rab-GTPase-TBC domain-containing protein [Dipodascopsis uninucleata]